MSDVPGVYIAEPKMVEEIGMDAAIFFQKLKYWSFRCGKALKGEEGTWVYNTYRDWQKQFPCWSLSKIGRIIQALRERGLIATSKPNARYWNQTNWYQVNFSRYDKMVEGGGVGVCSEGCDAGLSDEREDLAKRLIDIWEKKIELRNSYERLVQDKHPLLLEIFEKHFGSSVERWSRFVSFVSESPFLMGRTASEFRVRLCWVLKENNLKKVLSGRYHLVSKDKAKEIENKTGGLLERLKVEVSNPVWGRLLNLSQERWGVASYVSWFSKLSFVSLEDGVLKLEAPSEFIRSYMESRFLIGLEKISKNIGVRKIKLVVSGGADSDEVAFKKYLTYLQGRESLGDRGGVFRKKSWNNFY